MTSTSPRDRWRRSVLLGTLLGFLVRSTGARGAGDSTIATNRLAGQKSLYLRQHATNPVDWYPWGADAHQKARREDKPILVSIGYSTCHWCHVMERETFQDPSIAALLNQSFVCVKVDREERPDVDQIYMAALQAMGQDGGWPLNMWLTPDLEPFFGGTYFPPKDHRGRPAFRTVIQHLARAWKSDRSTIVAAGARARAALVRLGAALRPGDLDRALLDRYADVFERRSDPAHGGLEGAPKFPRSTQLDVLIRRARRRGEPGLPAVVARQLEGMARGGLRDHLAGGFHRYSTDSTWTVPHFEKMLYDNAQLASTYLEAFQAGGEPWHAAVARGVLDDVLTGMRHPGGAFHAATDADSEGREGRYFVWTRRELDEVLGPADGAVAARRYGVTTGGNFEDGASVLTDRTPPAVLAGEMGRPESELATALAGIRLRLLAARGRRVPPATDEKVVTGWNALTVSTLARAAQVLGDERYGRAAREALDFLLQKLTLDGKVYRRWIDGHHDLPGTAEDHAALILALLDVYETDFDEARLVQARRVADRLVADFRDPATGAFRTAASRPDLLVPMVEASDGAVPGANAMAAMACARLGHMLADDRLIEAARGAVAAAAGSASAAPLAAPYLLLALDFLTAPPVEVVISGEPRAADTRAMIAALRATYHPWKVVLLARAGGRSSPVSPLTEGKGPVNGRAAAYICRSRTCRAPVTTPEALMDALTSAAR